MGKIQGKETAAAENDLVLYDFTPDFSDRKTTR
jgi:hypothetical protein